MPTLMKTSWKTASERGDRHPPLEADRDVDGDQDEERDQGPDGLPGDLLAPGGADDVDAHLLHRDAGGAGEVILDGRLDVAGLVADLDAEAFATRPVEDLDLGVLGGDAVLGQHGACVVHGLPVGLELPGDAALEVDPQVQALEDEGDGADHDQDRGDGEPDASLAHEVEVGLAVVQPVPEASPLGLGRRRRRGPVDRRHAVPPTRRASPLWTPSCSLPRSRLPWESRMAAGRTKK